MSKFIFYKQCIKVHSSLNLKCIKFNQILLEKLILEIGKTHCCSLCKNRPGRPTHSRAAQLEKPGAFSRARPAKARPATPRAPPRGRLRSGQGNLGPGRAFPSLLGQKRPGHARDVHSRTIKIDGYPRVSG
jgi:hypothetical protein